MNRTRIDELWVRLGTGGRFRAELVAFLALLFALSHTGQLLDELGLGTNRRTESFVMVGILAIAIGVRIYFFRRIAEGNIFSFQYVGWYRIGKMLERSDDRVLVRLYAERFTERPKRVNVSNLKDEEGGGGSELMAISLKEFHTCEPKMIAYGELTDTDEKLIENPPPELRQPTLHH